MSVLPFFSWLNNIPFYGYVAFCLYKCSGVLKFHSESSSHTREGMI